MRRFLPVRRAAQQNGQRWESRLEPISISPLPYAYEMLNPNLTKGDLAGVSAVPEAIS